MNNNETVTDIDGNVYHTIKIGTQVWMVENLKTTHYNDGTAIPNVTDDGTWNNLETDAYCDYDNNPSYSDVYGRLYNWYTVNTGKLCPKGWHVPTDAEWETLIKFLGGRDVAGAKLKEKEIYHWWYPNKGTTNSRGFTALPGGYRGFNGPFYLIGYYGYWWSSTEYDTYYAWYRFMNYDYGTAYSNNHHKALGFSVRCLRD